MKGGITPMNTKQTVKGFTIIEVVLVLAIAGLIFLMVFIALPALQAGQRDTQRRSDASRVVAQITAYASANSGNVPNNQTKTDNLFDNYLKPTGFKDPKSNSNYVLKYVDNDAAPTSVGTILIRAGRICKTDGSGELQASGATARSVAVSMKLESGLYCTNTK